MKSSFTQLKEIIQSWYPENTFTDFELEEATKNLIKFFLLLVQKWLITAKKSDKN